MGKDSDLEAQLDRAAVEDAALVGVVGDEVVGEEAREDAPRNAPHPVHPEGVERVVVPQPVLQLRVFT